ncbi:DUF397 domain-containing protein [Streptomyces acidiscabies]|uniref:DUF397 domain-containing protein n=1 Tax=Streptomyces acidiscabies TaxID=42234 RepID=UPI000952A2B5|nr:DUF397 domain-containing protein [Streptomyces acidiscabies]
MTHTGKTPRTTVACKEAWRKSSYSDQSGGNCVEIADLSGQVGMRDSKVHDGPAILVNSSTFGTFLQSLSA